MLVRGNATYKGQAVLPGDRERRLADAWSMDLDQDNYIFIGVATGLPTGFVMNNTGGHIARPWQKLVNAIFVKFLHVNNTAWQILRSYHNASTAPIDAGVFALPDYCKTSTGVLNQCGGEWCPLLRNNVA